MTPSFLLGHDKVAVIGTPGGSRIITMVLLGMLELMDGGSAQAASDLPRYHHQYLPDVISAEAGAFSNDEIQGLQAKGHTVTVERSEEQTSERQSLLRISYALYCMKKKTRQN